MSKRDNTRYIVAADSHKKPGTTIFLQDPEKAPKDENGKPFPWTERIENAMAFTAEAAKRRAAGLKWGNPRVISAAA